MKAIYINLDPYIAAFAAWIKDNPVDPDTGKRATPAPTFQPLPLAVTIPLGESAAIYPEKEWSAEDEDYAIDFLTIDGVTVGVSVGMTGEGDALARDVVPGLSALAPAAKYAVLPVTGNASVQVYINDTENDVGEINFTVLVRREQAQGPVDLVDFTPPAAAPTAADIKSALVTAGPTALAGVGLGGTYLLRGGEGAYDTPTLVATEYSEGQYLLDGILAGGDEIQAPLGTGSASI